AGDGGTPSSNLTINVNVSRPVSATVNHLVISQAYGGGGNSGATLKNDFVELFNPSTSALSTSGLFLQYTSTAGTFSSTAGSSNNLALPATIIQPGAYYLVQMAAGAGGTQNLPAPDATGDAAMSATGGKIALVTKLGTLSGPTDNTVVDFVGWGAANAFEGSAAAPATATSTSGTTGILRKQNGCTDTDQNGSDFAAAAPSPRNSTAPVNTCN
ncbi:lamin tail domain-containing protein, partial [uncultured Deinococcus sp.]